MKKTILVLALVGILVGISSVDAQQYGSRKSFRINDTLFVDYIEVDSNTAIIILDDVTVTGTLTATVTNTDSLGHKSLSQIKVFMRDTANAAIRDSLANHYKKIEVRSAISDSIHLFDQITEILGALDSLASKLARNAFDDSVAAIDSTKITDGKLGIGDVNNLWALINERLRTTAANDSFATKLLRSSARDTVNAGLAAADSSKFTDGKLGIGDVNNLWALINARAYFSAMAESLATKATTAQLGTKKDTSQVEDDYHVSNDITISGTSKTTGLNDSLATKATTAGLGTKKDTSQVEDDAHVANTITIAGTGNVTSLNDSLGTKATPAQVAQAIFDSSRFPLDTLELTTAQWQAYIQEHQTAGTSASDISDSITAHRAPGIVTIVPDYPGAQFSVLSADTAIDSLLISATIQIPADFLRFNTDSALVVTYWASGNSTDSSYLELDVWKYPGTAELDSVKLSRNSSWGQIVVKATALTTNTWTDGDLMRLDFTVGIKNGHDVRLERIVLKYTRQ